MDNWKHRQSNMKCATCMWFVMKQIKSENFEYEEARAISPQGVLGRCRRHAPSMNGFVPVFGTDWCGDHRLDENKI